MEDVFEGVVKNIIGSHGFVRPKTPLPDGYSNDREVFFHVKKLKGDDVSEGDSVQFALDKDCDRQRPAAKWVKLKDGDIEELFKGVVIQTRPEYRSGLIRPTTALPTPFKTTDVFFKFSYVKGSRVYRNNAVSFRLEPNTFSTPAAQWVELDNACDNDSEDLGRKMSRNRSQSRNRANVSLQCSLPKTGVSKNNPSSSYNALGDSETEELPKQTRKRSRSRGRMNVPGHYSLLKGDVSRSPSNSRRDDRQTSTTSGHNGNDTCKLLDVPVSKTGSSSLFYHGRVCDLKKDYGFLKLMTKERIVEERKDIHFVIDKVESGRLKLKVGDLLKFTLRADRKNPDSGRLITNNIKLVKGTTRTLQEIDEYMQQVEEIIFSDLSQKGKESNIVRHEFMVGFLSCPSAMECVGNSREITVSIIQKFLNVMLYIGNKCQTLQQLVKAMYRAVWGSHMLDSRVGNFTHFIEVGSVTEIRQFILLSLTLVPEKARNIVAMTQNMISRDKGSCEQFLFSMLKKTVPLGTADTDDLNWNELPLVPTSKELTSGPDESELKLIPVREQGSYDSPDDYIDTYFRLLRSDCFQALREGIKNLLSGNLDDRDMNVYHSVKLMGIQVTKFGTGLGMALQITPKKKVQNWATCRQLMFGNLLCISPSGTFTDPIYLTVLQRDTVLLQKKNIIIVEICSEVNPLSDAEVISVLGDTNGGSIMVESPTYYKAYQPVLKALQSMDPEEMPFKEELVSVDVRAQKVCPSYLQNNSKVDASIIYNMSERMCPLGNLLETMKMGSEHTTLDPSQREAICHILSHRISIVQGPPGTGKTFIGLKVLRLILSATSDLTGPILVLTYKNHALDEMLKELTEYYKNDIVRIGGRSKDPVLAECNLNELKQEQKKSVELYREIQDTYMALEDVGYQIREAVKKVAKAKEFSLQTLLAFGRQEQLENIILECDWKKFSHSIVLVNEKGNEDQIRITKQYVERQLNIIKGPLSNYLSENESSILRKILQYALSSWEPDSKTVAAMKEEMLEQCAIDWNGDRCLKEDLDIDEIDVEEEQNERLAVMTGTQQGSSDYIKFSERIQSNLHLFISPKLVQKLPVVRLMNTKNLWTLSKADRVKYTQCLLLNQIQEPESYLQELLQEYRQLVERKEELEDQHKVDILSSKKIIGMTITGASMHHTLLQQVKPSVILVEEAAEVLEPQLLATLGNWVQHLIMIGDHKQLRPGVQTYRLTTKYHFDVSLMERLINNKFHHSTLRLQNRMRPEFADLLLDIYPELQSNMDRVCKNEKASCMEKSMYFWHHESDELPGRSYSNLEEANRVLQLSLFLLQQGYSPHQITILAAYQGQVTLIRRMIREAENKYPELFGDQNHLSEKQHSPRIQVHTIDLYQGDENDFVLVSLVRSNDRGIVGFLKVQNRRCVAQSRAKCGMYFVGNANTIMTSRHWERFLNSLEKKDCFGPELKLQCPTHPDSKLLAKSASDIDLRAFCTKPCVVPMVCKIHSCSSVCQPRHLHDFCHVEVICQLPRCRHKTVKECSKPVESIQCKQPCDEEMVCKKHNCDKKCDPKHLHNYCTHKIDFVFYKCGHAEKKMCSQDENEIQCKTEVMFKFHRCDHKGTRKCYQNIAEFHCREKCKQTMACRNRHPCSQPCWPEHSHDYCKEVVTVRYPKCGHVGKTQCSKPMGEIQCSETCKLMMSCKKHPCKEKCDPPHTHDHCVAKVRCTLPCEHKAEKRCYEKVDDILCNEQVPFHYPTCNHLGKRKCYVRERLKCPNPCTKKLNCGHLCNMTCGEPCNHNTCSGCIKEKEIKEKQRLDAEEHKRRGILDETKKKLIDLKRTHAQKSYETVLQMAGETAEEYFKVEDMVVRYIQSAHRWKPKIKQIKKIYNPKLEEKWLSARLNMFNPERNELKFHGTSAAAVSSIVADGFRLPQHPGMYGKGIYFATDSSKSQQYSKGSHILLVCDVLLGKSYQVDQAMNHLDAAQVKHLRYDSVYAKRGTAVLFDEFIVYDPHQAIVRYTIFYDEN